MPTQQNINMHATKRVFFQNSSIITVFVVVVVAAAFVVVACLFFFVLLDRLATFKNKQNKWTWKLGQ